MPSIRLSVLGAVLALAFARDARAGEPAVEAVLARNAGLEAAIARGDASAMAGFFSPDFRLHNSANRVLTGAQVLEQFRSGAVRFDGYERRIEAA